MPFSKTLFTGIFVLLSFSLFGQSQYYLDESESDTSFQHFIEELTEIVAQRDTTRLFLLLADSIIESKDGCDYGTKTCFIESMRFREDGDTSYFWTDAEKVLSFGFYQQLQSPEYPLSRLEKGEKNFQAPSYLKIGFDPFTTLFVHAERVNVREKPTVNSKVLTQITHDTLSYFNVMIDEANGINWPRNTAWTDAEGYSWVPVKLRDGRFGYIAERFTSLSILKEMTISKIKEEWKIVSFYNPPGC